MVERLPMPVTERDLRGLAEVLVDAIDSGAAVSFLAPLTVERAMDWWRASIARTTPIVLVERDAVGIVGTVQLLRVWAPNQPHRAEISKLMVHRRGRRNGIGARLVRAIETEARIAGYSLLTLDAKQGEAAERLYQRQGWTLAGTIPRYALDPDGSALHDAVIYYKELAS
jgi:GNAT superfamily N-acetyltransferase